MMTNPNTNGLYCHFRPDRPMTYASNNDNPITETNIYVKMC
jgi:hypothetical protein